MHSSTSASDFLQTNWFPAPYTEILPSSLTKFVFLSQEESQMSTGELEFESTCQGNFTSRFQVYTTEVRERDEMVSLISYREENR